MSKIKWGELSKYLPIYLLEKTNIEELISQEDVDEFNEVLVCKNPNRRGDKYREWDYAEFLTKNGNEFKSHSISHFCSTGPENREAVFYFAKGDSYIMIKGVHQDNYESIDIWDECAINRLYYAIVNGKITYKKFGDLFTISGVELPDETTTNK